MGAAHGELGGVRIGGIVAVDVICAHLAQLRQNLILRGRLILSHIAVVTNDRPLCIRSLARAVRERREVVLIVDTRRGDDGQRLLQCDVTAAHFVGNVQYNRLGIIDGLVIRARINERRIIASRCQNNCAILQCVAVIQLDISDIILCSGVKDAGDLQRQTKVNYIRFGSVVCVIGIQLICCHIRQLLAANRRRDTHCIDVIENLRIIHSKRCAQEADVQGLSRLKLNGSNRSRKIRQTAERLTSSCYLCIVSICDINLISICCAEGNMAIRRVSASCDRSIRNTVTKARSAAAIVRVVEANMIHERIALVGDNQIIVHRSAGFDGSAAHDLIRVTGIVCILLDADAALDKRHVCLNAKGRCIRAAFHIEERKGCNLTLYQTILCGIQIVELDRLGVSTVRTAKIQRQLTVDVHVNIVITGKGEIQFLVMLVHKLRFAAERKAAVVIAIIDRRSLAQQARLFITKTVNRVEAGRVLPVAAFGNRAIRPVIQNFFHVPRVSGIE